MRLNTFELPTPLGPMRRTGALVAGNQVVDLCLAGYAMEAAREAVDHASTSGDETVGGASLRHALDDVRVRAPLPRPNSLRDFLVFEEHLRNVGRTIGRSDQLPPESYNLPAHYKGNVEAIYGPDDVVPYPGYTEKLDYELEICAVVGKTGRRGQGGRRRVLHRRLHALQRLVRTGHPDARGQRRHRPGHR